MDPITMALLLGVAFVLFKGPGKPSVIEGVSATRKLDHLEQAAYADFVKIEFNEDLPANVWVVPTEWYDANVAYPGASFTPAGAGVGIISEASAVSILNTTIAL